jgi:hypothetical protein
MSLLALNDVSLRCKAMSGLGATADVGRRYRLDGSVAFDRAVRLAAIPAGESPANRGVQSLL